MNKKKIGSLGRPDDLRRQAEEIAREKTPQLSENLDKLSPEEQRKLFRKLQLHQIELTMQNESLQQTQKELESSQLRYFNLYDLAPVGYFTQNKEGFILEANLTAGSLLGIARSALVKKSLTRFIFREDQDIYYHNRKQLFETGTLQVCDLRMVKKNGSLFWVRLESTVAPDSESGDTLYYTVISDITKLKQAEEEIKLTNIKLEKRVKELNCLWEISNFIEKPGISLKEIFQDIVNLLPHAWQYSQSASARITLEGKEYKTKKFKETTWKVSSDILANKKSVGIVEVYYLEERPFQKEEKKLINIVAERLGNLIEGKQSETNLRLSNQQLKNNMDATIETISNMIEAKDPYTAGHQQRVSLLATTIAKELNLPSKMVNGIRTASSIHDIGKVSVATEILNKSTTLSDLEYCQVKEHSKIGYDILESIDFDNPVAQIVLQHHERLNGSGYPQELKGEDILLEAKIIGVADVVEAMSSPRPYRSALGIDAALEEIIQNRGILYEPEVVDICLKLFKREGFKLMFEELMK